MFRKYLTTISFAIISLIFFASAYGAEGGYSNYVPGFYGDIALAVEPGPGLSIRNDVYFYRADDDVSVRSGLLTTDIDIELSFDYLTFVYKPGIEVFGTQYVFGAAVVGGKVDFEADLSVGPLSVGISDDKTAFGDITLIPAAFFWNDGGNFHYSLSTYVVAPTGSYDEDDLANTSLNYWTFETSFAMTYLNESTGQDYSLVLGYGYNTENNDTDYQSGDEVHIDYTINQFLSESWAVGLQGFFYKQIGGDSGSGAILGDFKAEAAGIGPAIMWIPPRYKGDVAFVAKWISEYDSENRLEGDHVFLSLMMTL